MKSALMLGNAFTGLWKFLFCMWFEDFIELSP